MQTLEYLFTYITPRQRQGNQGLPTPGKEQTLCSSSLSTHHVDAAVSYQCLLPASSRERRRHNTKAFERCSQDSRGKSVHHCLNCGFCADILFRVRLGMTSIERLHAFEPVLGAWLLPTADKLVTDRGHQRFTVLSDQHPESWAIYHRSPNMVQHLGNEGELPPRSPGRLRPNVHRAAFSLLQKHIVGFKLEPPSAKVQPAPI